MTAYYVVDTFLGFEVTSNKGQSQPSRSLDTKERRIAVRQILNAELQKIGAGKYWLHREHRRRPYN